MKPERAYIITFENYIRLWNQLDMEYRRTQGWRWIRQFVLLHRMHNLTKDYERWYKAWLEN